MKENLHQALCSSLLSATGHCGQPKKGTTIFEDEDADADYDDDYHDDDDDDDDDHDDDDDDDYNDYDSNL